MRCIQTANIVSVITKEEFDYDSSLNSIYFETPWRFSKRIGDFVAAIEDSKHQQIAVCTHGLVIAFLLHHLTGKRASLKDMLLQIPPGNVLVVKNGKVRKISFKDKK